MRDVSSFDMHDINACTSKSKAVLSKKVKDFEDSFAKMSLFFDKETSTIRLIMNRCQIFKHFRPD